MNNEHNDLEHNPNTYSALFARFEEKLDNIASDLNEIKSNNRVFERDIKTELKELVQRVSALERFKSYALGIVAFLSVAATYFVEKFFHHRE